MESKQNPGTVSPDEASRALSAIATDQVAVRKTIMHPWWYDVTLSVCVGSQYAIYAIPDSRWWLHALAALLKISTIVVMVVLVIWLARHRTVKGKSWALLVPLRMNLIPIIVLATVMIILACVEPISGLPWWGHLCIGVYMAATTYPVLRWTWQKWTEAG